MWKEGNSYSLFGGVAPINTLWKSVWRLSRKLKTELPHDPAISLLGTHPENSKPYSGDAYTPIFITAIITAIAKN